jgi:hypothetical protein
MVSFEHDVSDVSAQPANHRVVIDCFTYYDETCKEMLELRYLILKDHVTKFAVFESNKTQSGLPIERKLRNTLQELNLPLDKFIIADVDIPEDDDLIIEDIDRVNSYQNQNEDSYKCRARERIQKNAIHGLMDNFSDDTFFIVSDCDEIINPENLDSILNFVEENPDIVSKIPLMHFEGRANLRVVNKDNGTPKNWDGAMFICKKHHLLKAEVIQIRSTIFNPIPILTIHLDGSPDNLGWHFSWMGNADRRKKKLNAFIHKNEALDFLETDSYNSKETMDRMEREPVSGEISVACETSNVLIEYPEIHLPKEIFQNSKLYNFFIHGTSNETINEQQIFEFLEKEYDKSCSTVGDIYLHLPVLRTYVKKCSHVTEMGVRTGESTRAILTEPVTLRSYDIVLDGGVSKLFDIAQLAKKDVKYIEGNTLHIEIEETDLLFIDTEHTYTQLSKELELHHSKVRKYIAFHDTDKPHGIELLPAIIEFVIKHPEWKFCYHDMACHGFTVIEKIN